MSTHGAFVPEVEGPAREDHPRARNARRRQRRSCALAHPPPSCRPEAPPRRRHLRHPHRPLYEQALPVGCGAPDPGQGPIIQGVGDGGFGVRAGPPDLECLAQSCAVTLLPVGEEVRLVDDSSPAVSRLEVRWRCRRWRPDIPTMMLRLRRHSCPQSVFRT
jgi:hypothetical protein